jgi:acetolactate synthase-1/2/3 large subunit
MTLSDLIVHYLEQFGVEYVFGIPGSPLGPLFDALTRSEKRGGPRMVLTRHEAGAAFMADGYARESGKLGVCCATTGPGATNLITGVAAACAEQVPMLVITPQTRLRDLGFGCFQDSSRNGIDTVSMFEPCTVYNATVTHPHQLEKKLAAALTAALGAPGGPAHLSIPIDVFAAEAETPLQFPHLRQLLERPRATLDTNGMERLCEEVTSVLNRGAGLCLLAGHHSIGAGREMEKFAELTGAALITTPRGKSAINPYHPRARGVFGMAGHRSARSALADEQVELILAVGTNLGEWSTCKWDPVLMNHKLVHIHNDRRWFSRAPMARLQVEGDTLTLFAQLNARLETLQREGRVPLPLTRVEPASLSAEHYIPAGITVNKPACCETTRRDAPIKAPQVYAELIQRLPSESRFFIDNSNSVPWSIHYFFHPRPENYHLSIEFATMAWAIGAAIGAAFANRQAPSVCLTGDGCYLMSGQEITVAVERQLPVIFVVLNDQGYGLIKHGHRLVGKEEVDFSIPHVDFAMLGRAAGAEAHVIRNMRDFDHLDWQALATRQGPTLLEILIDPEEQPTIAMA